MVKLSKFMVLIIVLVVAFVGYTFLLGGPEQSSKEQVLVIARPADGDILDPIQTVYDMDTMVTNIIYEPLMRFDWNMNRIPMLAENWYYNENGMYYEFKLRENVRFHCGYPFTAEAVAYTIFRAKTHPYSQQREAVQNIKDVKVVDKYTVRIYLSKEDRYLLDKLSMHSLAIVCPHCAEKYGDEFGRTHCCGTGPFKFKEWKVGDRIVLERYDNYNWGPEKLYQNKGPAYLDEIIFRVIREDAPREAAFEQGEVDFVTNIRDSRSLFERWRRPDSGIKLYIQPGASWVYLRFNCAGTKDHGYDGLSEKSVPKKVRQAVAYAIDENRVIDVALAGAAAPAHSWLADPVWGSTGYQEEMYPYDPDKARQLLAEAGYPNGLELELLYYDDPHYKRVAEELAREFENVGITLNIQQLQYTAFQDRVKRKDFQVILKGWTWPFADSLWYGWHTCRMPTPNRSFWGDNYTDQVMLDTFSMDDNKALEAIKKAQWLIADDAAAISIYQRSIKMAHRTYVKGYKIHPQAYNCWHFLDTYIEK